MWTAKISKYKMSSLIPLHINKQKTKELLTVGFAKGKSMPKENIPKRGPPSIPKILSAA